MKRDEIIRTLKEREADLRAQGVTHAAVFGSFARNEQRSDSDIDILVEFDGPTTFDRYFDLQAYLEGVFGRHVSIS